MKLSDLFKELIVGTAILPMLLGAVFAFENTFYPYVPVEINDGQNNTLQLTDNVNFLLNDTYKAISVYGGGPYPRLKNVFWNGTGLYFIRSCAGGYDCSNINTSIETQGYINKYFECAISDTPCTVNSQNIRDFSLFYTNSNFSNPDYMYISDSRWNNSVLYICLVYNSLNKQICFDSDNYLTNSLGFTYNPKPSQYGNSGSQIVEYFSNSPFSSSVNPPVIYSFSGSCPSVGQIKSSFGLSPAICYGGYDSDLIYTAGENTPIVAGSGLNLFQTYELFSGQMTIQNWYDTYRTYYNNISFNPYPFYNKPKALLGLMVARQSFGSTNGCVGSYSILNYCWYILNNFPDNANTCVVPNVLSQYPGLNITSEDEQCISDSINDDYKVHTPSTGSIFNQNGGLGGGGGSRGDEECKGIPCLFDKFYEMFTSSRINDVDFSEGGQGILPQYIALAFVVVVLFYVFKR